MNRLANFILLSLILCLFSCATSKKSAQTPGFLSGIDINFAGQQIADTLFVAISPIPADTTLYVKEYVEAIKNGRTVAIPVTGNSVHIPTDTVPSVYNLNADFYTLSTMYLRGDERVILDINSISPLRYYVKGTSYLSTFAQYEEFANLKRNLWKLNRHKFTDEEFNTNLNKMSSLLDTIMTEVNPETATYLMSLLDDDVVLKMFDKLPPNSENTLYYAHACALRNTGRRDAARKGKLESELNTSATVDLKATDLAGTTFDISSLRGKWVVVDFWVSWCGPCRRGFEAMKQIYADNSDKMEVVAIACGDQTDVWQNLIKELQLPWSNLLAPAPESHDGTVFGYPVSAFPTKMIIDPEGRLRDYIVGEDEEFYDKLRKMMQ